MDDVKFEMDRSDQGIADTLGSVGAILADTQVRSTPGGSGTARFIEGALYRREPTLKYNRRFAIDGHFQETRSLPQLLGSAAVSDLAPSAPLMNGFTMSNRIDYTKASPAGYKAFGGVYVYLQNCGLSKELINLVYLRISQINGCAYCVDMHSRDLLKSGLAVDKLVLVSAWRHAGEVFNTRERVALAWAETVTRVAETGVPDVDYEAAAAEFSDKELSDLTYAIGLMNVFNRLGVTFRTPPAAAAKVRSAP